MKPIVAVIAGMLIAGSSFAQNTNKTSTARSGAKVRRTAIAGTILDSRRQPVPKVQAYIYRNDTIKASGFAAADGRYETNSVLPGIYDLRLVYPASGKRITVTSVPVKALNLTIVDFRGDEPAADTTIGYTDLYPKVETKRNY
jgi:protocatechuate 3,4-dioxygenase beta subunit